MKSLYCQRFSPYRENFICPRREKLSFQYHDEKEETICLFSGKAFIWLENSRGEVEKVPMDLQKAIKFRLSRNRLEALDDCYFWKVPALKQAPL